MRFDVLQEFVDVARSASALSGYEYRKPVRIGDWMQEREWDREAKRRAYRKNPKAKIARVAAYKKRIREEIKAMRAARRTA